MSKCNELQQNASKLLAKVIKKAPKKKKTLNLMVDALNYLIMFPEYRSGYINAIKEFDPQLADAMDDLFMNIYFWPHTTGKRIAEKQYDETGEFEDELPF